MDANYDENQETRHPSRESPGYFAKMLSNPERELKAPPVPHVQESPLGPPNMRNTVSPSVIGHWARPPPPTSTPLAALSMVHMDRISLLFTGWLETPAFQDFVATMVQTSVRTIHRTDADVVNEFIDVVTCNLKFVTPLKGSVDARM